MSTRQSVSHRRSWILATSALLAVGLGAAGVTLSGGGQAALTPRAAAVAPAGIQIRAQRAWRR